MSEKFKKCESDIIEYFNKIEKETSLPIEIRFVLQINTKLKSLIKISKIPEQYVDLLKGDLLVWFNEEYFDNLEDEDKRILIEQELSRVECNLEKGTIKLGRPNLQTSIMLVHKYTWEKVEKANEGEKLFGEQKDDRES